MNNVLEYAPPATIRRLPLFRTALALFAICGIIANFGLIANSVQWVRFGSRAYRDLSLNPRAYGRLIEPVKIASLRDPYWVWAANAAAVLAALVGIFLALYVLVSIAWLRSAPEAAVRQMQWYYRWKMPAAVATLAAATCADFSNLHLEGAATRHISVGTWPLGAWPFMLFVGALIPWWWIGKALDSRAAAGQPRRLIIPPSSNRRSLARNSHTFSFGEKTPHNIWVASMTDARFGIAESVIEKGSTAEKYATRQIDRAKEESVHPWLAKLNERFAVVESWAGKCRVIEEQYDDTLDRFRLITQRFDDFQNRYMHIKVSMGFTDEGKAIGKPLGKWWLEQAHRRQYMTVRLAPGLDSTDIYNLWRGFGVQKPEQPGGTAVVLKGDQGTGKGMVAKGFGPLFGRHFMHVSDPKHLIGNFNAHLRDVVCLLLTSACSRATSPTRIC